jgi:lipopolysaccharide exporter
VVSAAKAARSVAWTIVTSAGARAFGLVGTLVLTRFLAPDVAGEVSAAHVICLSTNQLLTVGVGVYLIANPTAPRSVTFHATLIHFVLGLIAAALAIGLRGPLSPVFHAPGLVPYVPGLAGALLIDRVSFVPEKILVRTMGFRRIGISKGLAEMAMPLVAVGTAYFGAGGFCIVYGNLARATINALLIIPAVDRKEWLMPTRLERSTIKMLMSYGTIYSIGSLAAQASRRWDNLVVSRYFGPWIMGAYDRAYNLADIPSIQVGEQIADVLLASLANMEHERRVHALTRASGLLALLMFPVAVGLGAVGPEVARTFLDPRWLIVGNMLTLLSALAITRPLTGALLSYLQVRNRIRAMTMIECVNVLIMLACLVTFGRINYLWACAAIGVAFGARLALSLFVLRRTDGVPILPILSRQWRPLLACVPLVLAVLAVRHWFLARGLADARGLHAAPALALEIAAGGLAYVAAALLIARGVSRELIDLALGMIRRRRGEE